ncbi:MAG: hypothetical protein R2878_12860 [Thermoleophilia bacterium]
MIARLFLAVLCVAGLAGCGGGSDEPVAVRTVTVTTTAASPPAASPPRTSTPTTSTAHDQPAPPDTIDLLPLLRQPSGLPPAVAGPNSTMQVNGSGTASLSAISRINGGLAEDTFGFAQSDVRSADLPEHRPGRYRIDYEFEVRYSGTEPGGPIDDITVTAFATAQVFPTTDDLLEWHPTRGAGAQGDSFTRTGSTPEFVLDESPENLASVWAGCKMSTGGISAGTECSTQLAIRSLNLVGPLPEDAGGPTDGS